MIAHTRYFNDGKEKFQSHEMHVDNHAFQPTVSGDYHGSFHLTAYGADKDEATANLCAALHNLIRDAQETLESLQLKSRTAADSKKYIMLQPDLDFDAQLQQAAAAGKVAGEEHDKQARAHNEAIVRGIENLFKDRLLCGIAAAYGGQFQLNTRPGLERCVLENMLVKQGFTYEVNAKEMNYGAQARHLTYPYIPDNIIFNIHCKESA